MAAVHHDGPALAVLDSVCCLECGEIYSKPATGSAVERNPGCPACAYAGWIPVSVPREPRPPHRSGADLPPGLAARQR